MSGRTGKSPSSAKWLRQLNTGAEASVQNSQRRLPTYDLEPPAYETLFFAPPSESLPSAQRPQKAGSSKHNIAYLKKSLKEKWREMKEEDRRRKSERIQYVTPEEADRITGLDRRREYQARKEDRRRGLFSLTIADGEEASIVMPGSSWNDPVVRRLSVAQTRAIYTILLAT